MINEFTLEGIIGAIRRNGSMVFVRLVHKDSFFDKKSNDWVRKETWFSLSFFGRKAEALERSMDVGYRIIAFGDLNVFPDKGPTSQVRLNVKSFKHLAPFEDKVIRDESMEEDDLTAIIEGGYDEGQQ